jgi:putative intracellular protease/amidase
VKDRDGSSNFAVPSSVKVQPELELDAKITADQYGAITFIGFDTSEFVQGGKASGEVRRLLDEFKSQQRLVTAICKGQYVLAWHGELDGKQAARGPFADALGASRASWQSQGVVRDGQLITAGADWDAAPFAREIAAALGK